MFCLLDLTEDILVEPRYFGPKLRDHLERVLRDKFEGQLLRKRGYVICITEIKSTSQGEIQDYTGWALFHVVFSCVIYRPLKGEVIDAQAVRVAENVCIAAAGPLLIVVPTDSLSESGWKFDADTSAWRRGAGSADDSKLTKDTRIRLRITGLHYRLENEAWKVTGIGSISEPHLGVL
ncbi:unnamed protein product [Pedinophyceae sp. YPF-701]|nr:unnamed protein product [Pedinophyceae sp. YPF-701]